MLKKQLRRLFPLFPLIDGEHHMYLVAAWSMAEYRLSWGIAQSFVSDESVISMPSGVNWGVGGLALPQLQSASMTTMRPRRCSIIPPQR